MTFQKRLLRVMKRNGWRVADIARYFGVPYTTAREWVINKRLPVSAIMIERLLTALENKT
jgi:transcriptional regulator with XRE-family HTH domain